MSVVPDNLSKTKKLERDRTTVHLLGNANKALERAVIAVYTANGLVKDGVNMSLFNTIDTRNLTLF